MDDNIEEIDVGQFITEIEKRSSIWDIRTEEYKDRKKKDTAWYEICLKLVPNFAEKTKPEKKLICRKVQQKWRNIRDYHRKYTMKLKKCGSAKKFKYIYDDKLGFLTPLLGNGLSNTQEHRMPYMTEPDVFTIEESSGDPFASDIPQIPVFSSSKTEKSKNKNRKRKIEEKMCKFFDSFSIPAPAVEDEDKSFLDSLLPTLRDFNTDQKLDFRVEVLRVMQRIRLDTSPELMQPMQIDHAGEFIPIPKLEV